LFNVLDFRSAAAQRPNRALQVLCNFFGRLVASGTSSANPADLTNSAIQERGQKKFDPINNSRDRQILDDSLKQNKQNK